MRILAIETSCDETAVALLSFSGTAKDLRATIEGNALLSQIETHRPYGGVFPSLAKREHARNILPVLTSALKNANAYAEQPSTLAGAKRGQIAELLAREADLANETLTFLETVTAPELDAIAVTNGPGLEPALWVGVNFARALATAWDKPLLATNHMEGHIAAALATRSENELTITGVTFPVLALLISGGHTELVLMRDWRNYERVGATRDDAVGEAFDKAARLLSLPYPGGPELSKRAEHARAEGLTSPVTLPRPMLHDGGLDFSFSGLKTAVLHAVREAHTQDALDGLAREFEDAATEVLWKKTKNALEQTGAHTLAIGGGVSANAHIREVFTEKLHEWPDCELRIPDRSLTTDNALMIGLAAWYQYQNGDRADIATTRAIGNRTLA